MYETFYYCKSPFLGGPCSEWYFWAPLFNKALDLLMHTGESVVDKDCTSYWTWLISETIPQPEDVRCSTVRNTFSNTFWIEILWTVDS